MYVNVPAGIGSPVYLADQAQSYLRDISAGGNAVEQLLLAALALTTKALEQIQQSSTRDSFSLDASAPGTDSAEVDLLAKLHLRRSLALYRLQSFAECAADAQAVIDVRPGMLLAYVRLGEALLQLGDLSKAKEAYRLGLRKATQQQLAGSNSKLTTHTLKLQEGVRTCEMTEAKYGSGSGGSGGTSSGGTGSGGSGGGGANAGILLIKFPRTRHIFDAGGSGMTRDDYQ
jgi:uncharacterized membrane protein YgcG